MEGIKTAIQKALEGGYSDAYKDYNIKKIEGNIYK